jgi:PAS domain S-box-containing protein
LTTREALQETVVSVRTLVDLESRRAAVAATGLLDGPSEAVFDHITGLVCGVLQAPFSLVTLIDGDRQFFISSHGIGEPFRSARQGPLSTSYCRFVIDSEAPVVIRDAEINPLVSHIGAWKDGFISYLGVPVRDRNGEVVASVCAAGSQARIWNKHDLQSLEGIAFLVHRELENRAIQRELDASRSMIERVLESSPDCVKLLDAEGHIDYMNANGCTLLEIDDIASIQGQPWNSLWPDEVKPIIKEAIAKSQSGARTRFQAFCPTAKGTAKWWDVMVAPVEGNSESATKLVSVSRDITELKRVEEVLRSSEERFRSIYDHARTGIAILDLSGRLIECNPSYAALVGYTQLELGGLDESELVHVDDRESNLNEIQRLVANDTTSFELSNRYLHKDAGTRFIHKYMSLRRNASGVAVDIVALVTDMTEQHRQERELRASEERFRTFVTTAQEGIWSVDTNGRTDFVNPRFAEMLRSTPQAMVGQPLTKFCFDEDVEDALELFKPTLSGKRQEFEFRFQRSDGTPVHLLCATSQLRAGDGTVTGTLGGFLDLTERKRAENRQLTLMRELAHRGKNLLAVIQSIAGRTFVGDRSLSEARDVFIGRLHALANTYGHLIEEAFEGAPLDQIVSVEMKSFGDRVVVQGPRIMLTANVAQNFALVLHELATNAVKYGSLSVGEGAVAVTWRLVESPVGRALQFEWRESLGPPATPPKRRGFGSTLITAMVAGEFACTPELSYDESGFRYRFEAPLSALGAALDESPVRRKLRSDNLLKLYDTWASLRGFDGNLPRLKSFDRGSFANSGVLTIAEVDGDEAIRFVEVGRSLTERLGRPVNGGDFESDDPESLKEAYRRCGRTKAPCYQHIKFNFGGGDVVCFERLLLPFSRGERGTHIVGLVVYSGVSQSPEDVDRHSISQM